MTDLVDGRLYAELAGRNAADVVLAPCCEYNEETQCYTVRAWGGSYVVCPHQAMIRPEAGTAEPPIYFSIFLVNYLLAEKKATPAGQWISEKDLSGGPTFFRGPHRIPTDLIVDAFGDDMEMLGKRCRQLGGTPLDMADCSFGFDIIGSIRLALLYWGSDDDFEAEAKLLIDASVADTLQLDVVFALLSHACGRIAKVS
ncbi:DUF3786 domain-containing protein [Thiohalophilus sp.]|uniref:DUF3786 domain-containing protein n=1 Tax=Thiohalophilus sp. TaxID=3028392 RepID=UPI002ACED52E|nr:DUF3786 domain-containing protein [Thiohalophilus sp.]MDZ7803203.1 DUF3786 domain-containing protein [Thiohalophilus sp.]